MSEEPKISGDTSDGYHTFNELYNHRCLLWINLCLSNQKKCYLKEDHYEGWFLLGMETPFGQLSYHCPNKYLLLVEKICRREVEFDGHTPDDVLFRLMLLAENHPPGNRRRRSIPMSDLETEFLQAVKEYDETKDIDKLRDFVHKEIAKAYERGAKDA